jgi:hypothetical protein
MPKGSNGLAPRDIEQAKAKCPDHPTKRKFHSMLEAEQAAAASSRQYRATIVPYACAGCGLFHITGKTRGSDVVHVAASGTVRTAAMLERESLRTPPAPPARVDMEPLVAAERPVVPANKAAREKILIDYLQDKSQVSTAELVELLDCTGQNVSLLMKAQGWSVPRGPGARWTKRPLQAVPSSSPAPAPPAALAEQRDKGWRTLDWEDELSHIPVGDVLATMRLCGFEIRLQIRGDQ